MNLFSGGRPQPLIFWILLLFGLQTISFNLRAQPELLWAKSAGGTNNTEGDAIGVDASGNVYTAGTFYFTADFDPGPGVANLTATNAAGGWQDVFITKFDAAGNFVWVKQLGGASYEFLKGMAIDPSGNILLTG